MSPLSGLSAPRTDTNPRTIGLCWMVFSGSPAPARLGVTCPRSRAKWSSVYRQFRRWTQAGLWEQIMDALNTSVTVPDALQMIDSTVVPAHHQAPGAKAGMSQRRRHRSEPAGECDRGSAVQEVASRPGSTSASTAPACP